MALTIELIVQINGREKPQCYIVPIKREARLKVLVKIDHEVLVKVEKRLSELILVGILRASFLVFVVMK